MPGGRLACLPAEPGPNAHSTAGCASGIQLEAGCDRVSGSWCINKPPWNQNRHSPISNRAAISAACPMAKLALDLIRSAASCGTDAGVVTGADADNHHGYVQILSTLGSWTTPASADTEGDQSLVFYIDDFEPRRASTAGGERVLMTGGGGSPAAGVVVAAVLAVVRGVASAAHGGLHGSVMFACGRVASGRGCGC